MNTLKLISDQAQDQSFDLSPGVTTVGRLEDNQIQITHPTISSHHCELHLSDGTLLVKDLHSTNGTFINDLPVAEEGPLKPGDVLRLGDVRLLYQGPGKTAVRVGIGVARSQPSAPEFAPAASLDQSGVAVEGFPLDVPCHKHPRVQAEYLCTGCRTKLCEACIRKRQSGQKTWLNCTLCGSKVMRLADWHAQQAIRDAREHLTLPQRLGSAFGYPLAKGGLTFILVGAFILWLAEVARLFVSVVPLYGWVALIILLTFSYGWVFSYVQKIIVSCSNDEDVLPEWPEIANWSDDLVQPFLACLGVMCLCFGPAFAYSVFAAANDFVPMLYYPIFLLGAIYLPMAVVVVSLTQRVLSANPFVVLPAITKVPRDYLIVCLMFLMALGVWNGLGTLVDIFGPPAGKRGFAFERFMWEAGWGLPLWIVFLYLLIFCARVAGLMYRCNWRKFGWFKH
jgi:hypothetical protein